jgi:MOSC domain-containing protein YiiM
MKTNKILGKVFKLFISDGTLRNEVEKIKIDKNGILKDKYYKKNPNRAILVSSKSSYDLVKNNDISIEYGSLKENIIFDFNIHKLNIGDKIQIEEIILEISENCTICNQLKKIGDKVPKLLKDDRGIFVKTIKSGSIKIDDLVYKIDT